MTRVYTIEEVDKMRHAVVVLFPQDCNRAVGGSEAREAILKTYMQAGVEPADLVRKAKERKAEDRAIEQELDERRRRERNAEMARQEDGSKWRWWPA